MRAVILKLSKLSGDKAVIVHSFAQSDPSNKSLTILEHIYT